MELDRIDLKILHALQQDGRISNLKLSEIVALSPTANPSAMAAATSSCS